jgi:hypothetical protein
MKDGRCSGCGLLVGAITGIGCMMTSFLMVILRGGWTKVITKPRREGRWNLALVLMVASAAIGTLLFCSVLLEPVVRLEPFVP